MGFLDFLKNNKDALLVLTALGAALASVLAAYLSSRALRKNSIGHLRAEWIESLRNDIAGYVNLVSNMKLSKKINESVFEYNHLYFRIRLRLNETEYEHIQIVEAMRNINNHLKEDIQNDVQLEKLLDDLRIKTQLVFRIEWKRAAKGKI